MMKILNILCLMAIVVLASLSSIWTFEIYQKYKFDPRQVDYRDKFRQIRYKMMTEAEWSDYVKSFRNSRDIPKCKGDVLVEVNGIELSLPREGFGKGGRIEVNHTYKEVRSSPPGKRRIYQYFLDSPNPSYSCDQKKIFDVKRIDFYVRGKPSFKIYIEPPLGRVDGYGRYFTGEWIEKYLLSTHTKISTGPKPIQITDHNGRAIQFPNTAKYEDLDGGVTQAIINGDKLHYRLPADIYPDVMQNYISFSCHQRKDDVSCAASFIYRDSLYILYDVHSPENISEMLLKAQDDILSLLRGRIKKYDPIIESSCYYEHPPSEECDSFIMEQFERRDREQRKAGFE